MRYIRTGPTDLHHAVSHSKHCQLALRIFRCRRAISHLCPTVPHSTTHRKAPHTARKVRMTDSITDNPRSSECQPQLPLSAEPAWCIMQSRRNAWELTLEANVAGRVDDCMVSTSSHTCHIPTSTAPISHSDYTIHATRQPFSSSIHSLSTSLALSPLPSAQPTPTQLSIVAVV